jgi:hypothetical protein
VMQIHWLNLTCSGLFGFVLGFTGPSVVPHVIILQILSFLKAVFMHCKPVWESLLSNFLDQRLLSHSPVVLIFRENEETISRRIIYSIPEARPWGFQPRCGDPECLALPGSFHVKGSRRQHENHPFFKVKCLKCGWSSEYVPRPLWLQELPKKFFFWHHYPLSLEERQYILCETKRMRQC